MDLFSKTKQNDLPLSVRMRPKTLDEIEGQSHILGKGRLLRRCIESGKIASLILYGSAGTGKTALAYVISYTVKSDFYTVNAVTSNISEIRKIINKAQSQKKLTGKKTILFIDEIHRFNKVQQDVLLPEVEQNNIILIGATTHNPFFSIISALLSRSMIFELKEIDVISMEKIINRAIHEDKLFKTLHINLENKARDFIIKHSSGDARKALNALEIGILTTKEDSSGIININLETASECVQKKIIRYDNNGDGHYDTVSAYIKSIRGSDPDAAVYWLAKMLSAGEDPLFIARRMVIAASEDIGNADPNALNIANSAMQTTNFIGMPECRIILAQATIYLACCPKSNACYKAIDEAMRSVSENKTKEVPLHLKDSHYKGSKQLGRGKGYKYIHDYKDGCVKQEYMPEKEKFYHPSQSGYERRDIKKRENK